MPLNIAHTFTSTTHLDLDGDPYGLATAGLILHVYDDQTLATRLSPGALTIASTTPFNIDVDFAQATAGYLAIHPAIPATGMQGNYEAALTLTEAPYTVTILGSAHQLATKALLVTVYDANGAEVEPGSVQVHTSTYDVTVTFAQPITGRIVLCGGYGVGTPGIFDVTEASATWTVSAATHGLATDRLVLAVYTDDEPAEVFTPGAVTVEPDQDIVITHAQAMTGSIVLSGSIQTFVATITPEDVLLNTDTTTVRLRGHIAPTETVALTTTASLLLPVLSVSRAEVIPLTSSILFGLTLGASIVSVVSVTSTSTLLVPVLLLTTSTTVTSTETATVRLSLTVPMTETIGSSATTTVRLSPLVSVSETLPILDTATFSLGGALFVVSPLTLDDFVTVQATPLRRTVSQALSVTSTVLLRMSTTVDVDDLFVVAAVPIVRLGGTVSVSETIGLATQPTLLLPALPLSVTELLGITADITIVEYGLIRTTSILPISALPTLQVPILPLTVATAVSLVETLTLPGLQLPVSTTDSLAVTVTLTLPGLGVQMSLEETLACSATVTVQVPVLPLIVSTGVDLMTLLTFAGSMSLFQGQQLPVADSVTLTGLRLVGSTTSAVSLLETLILPGLHLPVQATETVAVADALQQVHLGVDVRVTASLGLVEGLTRSLSTTISVAETLPLVPTVSRHLPITLSVSDGVSVSETATVASLLLSPQVQETVGLGTAVTLLVPVLYLGVAQAITVSARVEMWEPYLPGLMVLDDMAFLLEEAALGTQGTTIFKGGVPPDMPLQPIADELIGLVELPGLPDVMSHVGQQGRVEQPQVQVIVRGSPHNYQSARLLAHEAWDTLDGLSNQRLNGTWYLWIKSNHAPYWLKTDELNRPYIVFTVRVAKEPAKV